MEEYKRKLSNLSTDKIPYETKITTMKASDSIKQKAFEKLKEINSSRDGSMTSKATKYLDGMLKIPFGIYKEEVIISFLDKFKIKIEAALKSDNNNTTVNTESDINNIFDDLQNNNLSLFEKNYSNLYNEWQEYNIKKVDYIKFVRQT